MQDHVSSLVRKHTDVQAQLDELANRNRVLAFGKGHVEVCNVSLACFIRLPIYHVGVKRVMIRMFVDQGQLDELQQKHNKLEQQSEELQKEIAKIKSEKKRLSTSGGCTVT